MWRKQLFPPQLWDWRTRKSNSWFKITASWSQSTEKEVINTRAITLPLHFMSTRCSSCLSYCQMSTKNKKKYLCYHCYRKTKHSSASVDGPNFIMVHLCVGARSYACCSPKAIFQEKRKFKWSWKIEYLLYAPLPFSQSS